MFYIISNVVDEHRSLDILPNLGSALYDTKLESNSQVGLFFIFRIK